jgi:ornithine carbamoyltransferase
LIDHLDLSKDRFLGLLVLAAELKRDKARKCETPRLSGAEIVTVFEKHSTRTRCAFEVAAHDQGAHITYLGPDDTHINREESVPDTARVLGRVYDGIAFRGFAQKTVDDLAAYSGVPVWNALTDEWHPTQMLADVLTMTEHSPGALEDIVFCFTGDGRNNVARSLLLTGAMLGMDVRIAAPPDRQPPAELVRLAVDAASTSGARVLVTDDVNAAVRSADFVYTDVWVSMGDPDDAWKTRLPSLLPYRVTADLLRASGKPDVKFMHCLPALHNRDTELGARLFEQYGLTGAEVTEEVFESAQSIVFDQSANRMPTIKAVLVRALGS